MELKKNISILLEAISLARKDLVNSNSIFKFGRNNKNLDKKKWVRNGENDRIITSNKKNLLTLEMKTTTTNQSKKDTINEEKIQLNQKYLILINSVNYNEPTK